jgi:predicted dehydrogenase
METVSVAVIGLGLMGSHYARILRQTPTAELVAVCDREPGRAQALATELDVPWCADVEELLDRYPALAAVAVTTPEANHVPPALAAAAAGKHLLVEKPLATTLEDCERIVGACRGAGVVLMVGHHSHFDPRFGELKRALDDNVLGSIVHMYGRRNLYATSASRISGRVSLIMWAGVHDIEVMRWFSAQPVRSVFAKSVSKTPAAAATGVADAIAALLSFGDGSMGILEYSWAAPAVQGNPSRYFFAIVGSEGFAEIDYGDGGLGIFTASAAVHPDMTFFPRLGDRWTGQYREQILHFLDCILHGRPPVIPGEEAASVVAVASALERSVAEGREIVLD